MGGTEFRSLVGFDGRLYAGIGYWEDQAGAARPGAQIVVLDAPSASWRVELELKETLTETTALGKAGAKRYFAIGGLYPVTVTTDGAGAALASPVHLLLAGPWSHGLGIDVFERSIADATWSKTTLNPAGGNVRSFADHIDTKTHVHLVFAGSASSGKTPEAQTDSALMYTATLDAKSQKLAWKSTPEGWCSAAEKPALGWRVMAFAEANGALFSTIGASLYERVDGPSPCWTKRSTATFPARVDITANGGLRGLHAIPSPCGKGDALLVAVGGPEARVVRIDVGDAYKATVDQDVVPLLQKKLSIPDISGSLFAYNDMLDVDDPDSGEHLLVMGLEAMVKIPRAEAETVPMWFNFLKGAHYMVRHANGTYDVLSAEDASINLADGPPRVSTRTLAISPFDPTRVFLGGFDANSHPVHDTAWALTGTVATLLHGAL